VSGASATRARCLEALDVFVLAGGLGTRIRPVLGDVPKILAPISGRPYLAYLLDWLERFGARRVVLGLGHRAQVVIDHLAVQPRLGAGRMEITTVVEPSPLGTAGAIRFARGMLWSDPVLIMNGDSFTDADLCAFVEHHCTAGAAGSVLCAEVDDAGRFGRIDLDQQGYIRGFVEKDPAFHERSLINAGVYLLSAKLLDEIAAGHAASLERDVFECLPPGSLAALAGRFRFIDIGTPQSLALAADVLHAGPQV
jgi:NDP-sugar pyrophosphorylase family protein